MLYGMNKMHLSGDKGKVRHQIESDLRLFYINQTHTKFTVMAKSNNYQENVLNVNASYKKVCL